MILSPAFNMCLDALVFGHQLNLKKATEHYANANPKTITSTTWKFLPN